MPSKQYYVPLSTLKELRQKIIAENRRIRNTANTVGMVDELFAAFVKPVLRHYQPIISPLAEYNSNLVYRARRCINGKPFGAMSDLYNPPIPSGRAFSSMQIPILYASSSIQTSMAEIDAKIGDLICIASFDYSAIKEAGYWFVGQLGAFYKSQESSRYLGDELVVQRPFYAPNEATIALVYKDALLNEIFSSLSSEADQYMLNRFLISEVGQKVPGDSEFLGVVFLSVKDAPGINFAVFGDAIPKLLPRIVNLVEVTDIDDYGCIAYALIENSSPKNGKLEWQR